MANTEPRVLSYEELFQFLKIELNGTRGLYQEKYPFIHFKEAFVELEKLSSDVVQKYLNKAKESKQSRDDKKSSHKSKPSKTKVKIDFQPTPPSKAKVSSKQQSKDVKAKKKSVETKTEKTPEKDLFGDALFQPDKSLLQTKSLNNFKIPKKVRKDPTATTTKSASSSSSSVSILQEPAKPPEPVKPSEPEEEFDINNEPEVNVMDDILGNMTYPPVLKPPPPSLPPKPVELPKSPPTDLTPDGPYDETGTFDEGDAIPDQPELMDQETDYMNNEAGSDSGSSQEIGSGVGPSYEMTNPHDDLDYLPSDEEDDEDDKPYRRRGSSSSLKSTATSTFSRVSSNTKLPQVSAPAKLNIRTSAPSPFAKPQPKVVLEPQLPAPKYQFCYDHNEDSRRRKAAEEAKRQEEVKKRLAEEEEKRRLAEEEVKRRRAEKFAQPIGQIKTPSNTILNIKKRTIYQGKVSPRDPRIIKKQPIENGIKDLPKECDSKDASLTSVAISASTAEAAVMVNGISNVPHDSSSDKDEPVQTKVLTPPPGETQVPAPVPYQPVTVQVEKCQDGQDVQDEPSQVSTQLSLQSDEPHALLSLDSELILDEISEFASPTKNEASFSYMPQRISNSDIQTEDGDSLLNGTPDQINDDDGDTDTEGDLLGAGGIFSFSSSDKKFADIPVVRSTICYTSKYSEVITIPLEPVASEMPEDPRICTGVELVHDACPPVNFEPHDENSSDPRKCLSLAATCVVNGKRELEDGQDGSNKRFKYGEKTADEPSLFEFLKDQGNTHNALLPIDEIRKKRSIQKKGAKTVIVFSTSDE